MELSSLLLPLGAISASTALGAEVALMSAAGSMRGSLEGLIVICLLLVIIMKGNLEIINKVSKMEKKLGRKQLLSHKDVKQ